jgi:hypothetical protein
MPKDELPSTFMIVSMRVVIHGENLDTILINKEYTK